MTTTTWAWVHERTGWGYSNAGLIASGDQALLVDTQFTLAYTRQLLREIAAAVPKARITTVVNTHGNGDHTWGNQLVDGAEIVTSATSAAHLCQEMGPGQLAALSRAEPTTAAHAYIAEHFGAFDFTGVQVMGPTRTFSGSESMDVGGVHVELMDLGPGHSAGDVAVHVPADGVVFTGDAVFNGSHMIVWSQHLSPCIRACDQLLATGADTFVPGHGPVTGRAGMTGFRDYLERVWLQASAHAAAGVELSDAARLVFEDQTGGWEHPERLFTAVAAAYREADVDGIGSGTMACVEGMAELAAASVTCSASAGTTTMSR
ncbi:MBL fold metallo-hydrolase [Streptomyces sp. NPDC048696]|uniref:MBL fold metallo-hydrolase n=1 Tax=Streptomyces sp. NPDC048696 TaxID=3365585 RepID=UPI003721786F